MLTNRKTRSTQLASKLAAADETNGASGPPEAPCSEIRAPTPPKGAQLWGFVRRHDDVATKSAELLSRDIGIWFDRLRCRFLIANGETLIDDLAPIEFVLFVRELRHSRTQVLFKIQKRHDGSRGSPVCVWRNQPA